MKYDEVIKEALDLGVDVFPHFGDIKFALSDYWATMNFVGKKTWAARDGYGNKKTGSKAVVAYWCVSSVVDGPEYMG